MYQIYHENIINTWIDIAEGYFSAQTCEIGISKYIRHYKCIHNYCIRVLERVVISRF